MARLGWRASVAAATLALAIGSCSAADQEAADTTATSDTTDHAGNTATTGAVEPGQYGEFSMLSYNVAGLPQEISTVEPTAHIPLVSPLLEPYDIVMTQEDFDWWVDDLDGLDFAEYHDRLRAENTFPYATEAHPGPAAVGIDGEDPMRPLPLVGDGLGFLSRFPFTDVVRVPWAHCFGDAETGAGDCLAMKGFMVATFELAPGVEIDVYTLHGEAGEGPDDQPLQVADYEQLAAFIAEHSPTDAILLAGDTNLHLEPGHDETPVDTPIWEGFLSATGLTDVCTAVECADPGTIDKVAWRDGDGVVLEPLTHAWLDVAFVDADGNDLSDHPPVLVEWRWTAAS